VVGALRALALVHPVTASWSSRIVDVLSRILDLSVVEVVPAPEYRVLDEPERYVPRVDGRFDLILCLGLPGEYLLAVPGLAAACRARCVLVPVDSPEWGPPGLARQVSEELGELGVKAFFPRPFCTLTPIGDPVLDVVASRVGRPLLEVYVRGGVVVEARVLRCTPCCSTRFVAERLVEVGVDELRARAGLLHSYACLASRSLDPLTGDSLIHVSSRILAESIVIREV